jgi:hypothetical protein
MMVVGVKDQNGDIQPFGYQGQREYYIVVRPAYPRCEAYFIHDDGEITESINIFIQDSILRNIATGSWGILNDMIPIWVVESYRKQFNIPSYEKV